MVSSIMLVLMGLLSLTFGDDPNCTKEQELKCPVLPNTRHYPDIGCQPVRDRESCCVTAYDCSVFQEHVAENYTGCFFRGERVDKGTIPTGDPCQTCHCSAAPGFPYSVSCVAYDCHFTMMREPGQECTFKYSRDDCCADRLCGEEAKRNENEATCTHNGKTYNEGDQITDFPSRPCRICICDRQFVDADSSSCYDMACALHNVATLRRSCAPIYFEENGCCPIDYHCPDVPDVFVPDFQKEPRNCIFGNASVPMGAELPIDRDNVKCTCRVPPLVTCVQSRSLPEVTEILVNPAATVTAT